jgi:uncharacterized protein (UPF0261 family)
MSMSTILLIGTLDTKGHEYAFVRDRIRTAGHDVIVMDIGITSDPDPALSMTPEVSAADVARAGGGDLAEMRARADRGSAVDIMQKGACALVPQLYAAGRFQAVLGLGGGGGTTMITAAMRTLPVGVPKLMVSTMASGNTAPYVDVKDITLMYSVVDIAGLNPLSRRILANAAGAICGMAAAQSPQTSTTEVTSDRAVSTSDRPLLAATMFGVTTPCVTMVRERLEQAGYDVLVFHATGTGGRAMEGLIEDGYFAGVVDITTTEWCDEVVGGVLTAGPDRLGAAARKGLPQVVSVGALDMVNFGGIETVPEKFRDRTLYKHNATVTLMRTTPDECKTIGRRIAEQLNRATGPVVLMLPLRGVSAIDAEGKPFADPEADRVLFETLRAHATAPHIRIVDADLHINDPAFAEAIAARMLELLTTTEGTRRTHAIHRT